jgi:exportin-1
MQQSGEQEPFIDEILRNLQRITADLSPLQIHTFYEAVGYMISAQPNKPQQELLIMKLMEAPNAAVSPSSFVVERASTHEFDSQWDAIMAQAVTSGTAVLADPTNIKILSNVLKTNVSACSSVGTFFLPQIARIYLDLLGLYTAVSGIISATTAEQGLIATKTPKVRGLRTIKKEILKLVGDTYIKKAEDLEQVNQNLIPPLLEAILGDYKQNIPAARDAEVLSVMVTIVTRLCVSSPSVFFPDCTLMMYVGTAPDDGQDPRRARRRLRVHARHDQQGLCREPRAPPGLLPPHPRRQPLLFRRPPQAPSCAVQAHHGQRPLGHEAHDARYCRHWTQVRPSSLLSCTPTDDLCSVCLELIDNVVAAGPETSNGFFQAYYLSLLQDMFFILTDSDHKSSFKQISVCLARLFRLVESNDIQAPLFDPSTQSPTMTNSIFVAEYCVNLLKTAFPHLQPSVPLPVS